MWGVPAKNMKKINMRISFVYDSTRIHHDSYKSFEINFPFSREIDIGVSKK